VEGKVLILEKSVQGFRATGRRLKYGLGTTVVTQRTTSQQPG